MEAPLDGKEAPLDGKEAPLDGKEAPLDGTAAKFQVQKVQKVQQFLASLYSIVFVISPQPIQCLQSPVLVFILSDSGAVLFGGRS